MKTPVELNKRNARKVADYMAPHQHQMVRDILAGRLPLSELDGCFAFKLTQKPGYIGAGGWWYGERARGLSPRARRFLEKVLEAR